MAILADIATGAAIAAGSAETAGAYAAHATVAAACSDEGYPAPATTASTATATAGRRHADVSGNTSHFRRAASTSAATAASPIGRILTRLARCAAAARWAARAARGAVHAVATAPSDDNVELIACRDRNGGLHPGARRPRTARTARITGSGVLSPAALATLATGRLDLQRAIKLNRESIRPARSGKMLNGDTLPGFAPRGTATGRADEPAAPAVLDVRLEICLATGLRIAIAIVETHVTRHHHARTVLAA